MIQTETNWIIITGGPSTGKSKTIDHIAFLGYYIRPEVARIIIDNEMSKGKILEEIRGNQIKFEEEIVRIKIKQENEAPKNDLIFWERGMPDSIVYLKDCCNNWERALQESKRVKYKSIFILDILPHYEKDYARTENAKKAKDLHQKLNDVYIELGYSVTRVPVMSIEDRAKFIVNKAKSLLCS